MLICDVNGLSFSVFITWHYPAFDNQAFFLFYIFVKVTLCFQSLVIDVTFMIKMDQELYYLEGVVEGVDEFENLYGMVRRRQTVESWQIQWNTKGVCDVKWWKDKIFNINIYRDLKWRTQN
jgi:hypothetical protein